MGEIYLARIDDNLIFLLNIMPDKNFINIIKNSGGLLGSPSKRLNNQYRQFLINKKLRRTLRPKIIRAVLNEVKTISNENLEENQILPLLCKYYLAKNIDKFNDYKEKYYITNKKASKNDVKELTRKAGDNDDSKRLVKVIEKQKKKIVELNSKYQTLNKNVQHFQNKSNQLETMNAQQKKTIINQRKQLHDATVKIAELKSKLISQKSLTNNKNIYQNENKKLKSRLSYTEKAMASLKKDNFILKKSLDDLHQKLISLNMKRFLLIGMPVGFKYGSIRIPQDTELQIAVNSMYVNVKDKKIAEYSSIDDLTHILTRPLESYRKIIIFNGEVTRKDIMELNNRVNKDKLSYINGTKELEKLLDEKGENK